MSFARAPLRRFNDDLGCAPPPGTYDVETTSKTKGAVSFPRGERFLGPKEPKRRVLSTSTCSSVDFSFCRLSSSSTIGGDSEEGEGSPAILGKRQKGLLKDLQNENKTLHTYLEQVQEEMQEVRLRLEAELKNLRKETMELRKETAGLQDSEESAKTRAEGLVAELQKLRVERAAEFRDQEVSRLLTMEAEGAARKRAAALEDNVRNLPQGTALIGERSEGLQVEVKDLREETTRLQENEKSLKTRTECLEAEVKNPCEQAVELRQEKTRLQENKKSLKMHAEGLEAEVSKLQVKYLREETIRLQESEKSLTTRTEALDAVMKNLCDEAAELREENTRLQENSKSLKMHTECLEGELMNFCNVDSAQLALAKAETRGLVVKKTRGLVVKKTLVSFSLSVSLVHLCPQAQLQELLSEREFLTSTNAVLRSELREQGQELARVLGHNNSRQRIHHVMQIKQDNTRLFEEVCDLKHRLVKVEAKSKLTSQPRANFRDSFRIANKENNGDQQQH
ncbi:unnamed protein product [Lampetra fluviatilis]